MNVPSLTLFKISLLVLAASAAASLLLVLAPERRAAFDYLYWIHVAIIVLALWAFWRSRKLRTTWLDAVTSFWRNVPRWLLALAVPVVVLLLPAASSGAFNLGELEDGTPVQRKSWFERDGKYWLRENDNPPRELEPAEYERIQLQHNQVFAAAWVLFSYLTVLQWHYVWRREAQCGLTPRSS